MEIHSHTCGPCCSCGCRSQWMIRQRWKWPFPTVFSDLSFSTLAKPWKNSELTDTAHAILQPVYKSSTMQPHTYCKELVFPKRLSTYPWWLRTPNFQVIAWLALGQFLCTGIFSLSLSLTFCVSHMMKYLITTPRHQKSRTGWQRTRELFWHSHLCQDHSLHCHFSIYLEISQLNHRECMCAHLHRLSPAAGEEVFCWHSASPLCWNSNKSWNSKKSSSTVSHKHTLKYQDTGNPGEFVTKEKVLHKRNQATQNFLMEWN